VFSSLFCTLPRGACFPLFSLVQISLHICVFLLFCTFLSFNFPKVSRSRACGSGSAARACIHCSGQRAAASIATLYIDGCGHCSVHGRAPTRRKACLLALLGLWFSLTRSPLPFLDRLQTDEVILSSVLLLSRVPLELEDNAIVSALWSVGIEVVATRRAKRSDCRFVEFGSHQDATRARAWIVANSIAGYRLAAGYSTSSSPPSAAAEQRAVQQLSALVASGITSLGTIVARCKDLCRPRTVRDFIESHDVIMCYTSLCNRTFKFTYFQRNVAEFADPLVENLRDLRIPDASFAGQVCALQTAGALGCCVAGDWPTHRQPTVTESRLAG
jgi:hypothetical protein